MRMLRWICGNTRRDRVRNDDIHERLRMTSVKEKLVQHHFRWFGHIQRRPTEALIYSGVIRWTGNKKRGRKRPNLTWEESMKRYLKDWSITKEVALDRREWKLIIHVSESWSSAHSSLLPFYESFFFFVFLFTPFHFFVWLSVLLSFLLFLIYFLSSFIFSLLFHPCFISCDFISSLP
jgi:hypothetical protein